MKLWQKDSTVILDPVQKFTVGKDREFDMLLAKYDIEGSLAHITMLEKVGLLSSDEWHLLSDELKKKREDELYNREKEVRDLQKKRFGFEGDLFKKRQELIKPIQDKVYIAIQKLAIERSYDFILDKSEGITIIFADPKPDKSEDVLKELGVK